MNTYMNIINENLVHVNWELTSPMDKLFSNDHDIDAYLKEKKTVLSSRTESKISKV
jgi:hypothetical protein